MTHVDSGPDFSEPFTDKIGVFTSLLSAATLPNISNVQIKLLRPIKIIIR